MEVFFGLLLVVGVGAAYWVHRQSDVRRALRTLQKTPLCTVAEAKVGAVVKLRGTLRYADAPIEAALSGRECAYFRVVVHEKTSSGVVNIPRWISIVDESQTCRELWLEDQTGKVLVQLVGAFVVLAMDARFRSGFLHDAQPELEAFLQRHDLSSIGHVFNRSLRYREGVLEDGEEIVVLGRFTTEPDPEPRPEHAGGYRAPPMRARLVAPKGHPILISDDPEAMRSPSG